MSDVDKKLAEIRERHERDSMWCIPSSIAGPQAHDDRAFLLAEIVRLRADLLEQASLLGMGAEREEKLRARVEVLGGLAHQSLTVLQCSDGHSAHWCAHCDDNIGGSHIVALRAALEAKP